jgi:hypothetical protein
MFLKKNKEGLFIFNKIPQIFLLQLIYPYGNNKNSIKDRYGRKAGKMEGK